MMEWEKIRCGYVNGKFVKLLVMSREMVGFTDVNLKMGKATKIGLEITNSHKKHNSHQNKLIF